MGQAANQIVSEIEAARTDLDRDLDAFEADLGRELNWKRQFRRHPWLVLGCVVVVGLIVTKLVRF